MLILCMCNYMTGRDQGGVTNVKFSPVSSCQEGGDLFVVFGVVSYHLRPVLQRIIRYSNIRIIEDRIMIFVFVFGPF